MKSTSPARFSALTALNVVAVAEFCILPTVVAGTQLSLNFSAREVGVLSALFMAASVIGSTLSKFWIRRVSWPAAARLTLLGMAAANALCLVFHEREAFLALQCVAGFFGGSLYSLTLTVLADGKTPDRDFGIVIAAQVVFQGGGLMAGPLLLRTGGINAVLTLFIVLCAASLFVTGLLPIRGRTVAGRVALRSILTPWALTALAGCFCFFLNTGCYWTFIELIGHDAGFSEAQIARYLVIGVGAGFIGAVTASVLGARYPRNALLGVGAIMIVVSVGLLAGHVGVMEFVISSCLLNFSWNFSVAYQYAAVNAVDTTGYAVALAPAFHGAGAAVGPAIAALLVAPQQYGSVLWLVAGGSMLSFACFVVASAIRNRVAGPALGRDPVDVA